MSQKKLYLASGSPRRKELLEQLGYPFSIIKPDIEECRHSTESPRDYVTRLSIQKAQAGLTLAGQEAVVIGSDTIVVLGQDVLEKPSGFADAKQMLERLSGKRHQVMTAVSVLDQHRQLTDVVTSDVWFKSLTTQEISQYWQTGEPIDKAGSYAIQGVGGRFVARIEGSYHAIVGLPLLETDLLLTEFCLK